MSVGIELAPGTLDRLRGNLAQLEKGINLKVNLDPAPLQAGANAVNNLHTTVQKTSSALSDRLGGAAKAAGATITALGVAGGLALVGIATKAIQAGKEFNILQQQVRAGLKAVLGTTAAAEGLLKAVNNLNDTSPFPRSAFLAATQQLVGFGIQAEKVVPVINAVQQAVAGIGGDSNDIATFTRAFAQIQSQGKLTGDVLFTLGAKGVDAATIIGNQLGKTGQQIKDEVTKGTIGADQAIDLLTTGLTQKFAGATDNVAKSFAGASQRVQARLRDIGAALTKIFINPTGGGAGVDILNNIAVGLGNIKKNAIPGLLPSIQTMADLFVKASKAFVDFTANIKAEQVQKFLDVLKSAAPIVTLLGTNLVKSIGGSIPILSTFTNALSGPTLALATFALSVPAVREGLQKVAEQLQPVVTSLLPTLISLLTTSSGLISSLAPIVVGLAQAFAGVIQVVAPILNVLIQFGEHTGILTGLITFLIARLVLLKLTTLALGGAFSGLSGVATAVINGLSQGVGGIGAAARAAGGGVAGLASSMGGIGLATVGIGLAGALIGVIGQRASQATAAAKELASTLEQGRNLTNLNDQKNAFQDINRLIEEQKGKLKDINSRILSFTTSSNLDRDAAKKKISALEEERNKIVQIREVQDDVLSAVGKKTGESLEDVLKRATAAGIDFQSLRFDQGLPTIDKLVKGFDEVAAAAQDATGKLVTALTPQVDALEKVRAAQQQLTASQKSLADLQRVSAQELQDNITKAQTAYAAALDGVRAAADRVISSQLALTAAQRGIGQAQDTLNIATTKLNRLLADTGAAAREVADAETTLAKTGAELRDQDERRVELQRDLANLARDTPDKLAAGDRAIERAKISLNTATREQLNLENELHNAQIANVDLTGLTPAQIKLKLAQVKAQIESQRLAKGTLKTEQQIKDEVETAALNKTDAEAALKASIQSRADLELSLNTQKREDEQALQALQLDHEASLRRQFEQQQQLTILRTGDTQNARDLKAANLEVVTATEAVTKAAIDLHTAEDGVLSSKRDQQSLTIDIREKERDIETSKFNQKQHYIDIKLAQEKTKDDAIKLKEATGLALGDNLAINQALIARLGLNSQLLAQSPDLIKKIVGQIVGPIPFGDDLDPNSPTSVAVRKTNQLTDILTNHPDQLLDFLRKNGFNFAEGGVVNTETFARIGEAGREVVLPLTRPARMVDLLGDSQVLNPVLAALGRISLPSPRSPITNTPSSISSISGSGSNVVVRREDGPMTYGQAREIIALLEANGKGELKIEAPITINRDVDEAELIRTISRQLERKVEDIMNKRRGR